MCFGIAQLAIALLILRIAELANKSAPMLIQLSFRTALIAKEAHPRVAMLSFGVPQLTITLFVLSLAQLAKEPVF